MCMEIGVVGAGIGMGWPLGYVVHKQLVTDNIFGGWVVRS